MKAKYISIIALIFITLIVALVIFNFYHPVAAAQNPGATSLSQQAIPTPTLDDTSVIGSTDGIMLMGVIISMIIIAPLLFRKKKN